MAEATNHWTFQALRTPRIPDPPAVGREISLEHPIDRFVARRYVEVGASMEPAADRQALLRRLSFDLRGLPPTPEETARFVSDTRPDAWERWIEAFLSSPDYGERWGRHWLDIAGYADSNGYFNADSDRPLAFKYRDYVVRSIQRDMPFDRFIQEQIAGDELVGYARGGDITPEMVEPLVATGFLRTVPDGTGESDGNPLEVKVDRYTVLEGAVQQIGSAFLGITLQCARCHAHKFEPVKQEEYYGLQAILRPGYDPENWLKPNERVLVVGTRAEREATEKAIRQHERDAKTLNEAMEALAAPFRWQWIEENLKGLDESVRKSVQQALDKPEKERTESMRQQLKTHAALVEATQESLEKRFPEYAASRRPLQHALSRLDATKPLPLERIAAFHEPAKPPPVHRLLVRGNHATEGEAVEPMVPVSLTIRTGFHPERLESSQTTGRRLALARWLTSPDNPVVARVLVNRVWNYHFGQGLVPTLENLGQSGGKPSSVELVDWLASEFVRSGWSLKQLHRLILTSATWRQRVRAEVPETIPGLLKAGPSRLDAEALRDAMLTVSGELDRTMGGAYVPIRVEGDGQITVDEKTPGARRRSMYLQQRRTQPPAMLQVFDGPAHNPVCVQRVQSTVALQSLTMLNSEFVRLRSRAFARRLLGADARTQSELDPTALDHRLGDSIRWAYGREPLAREIELGRDFLQRQTSMYPEGTERRLNVWTDYCQMILASNEFLYVE